jgi:hypothetical protein
MPQTRPNFDPATGDDTSGALRKLDNNCVDLDTRVAAASTAAGSASTAAAAAQTTANAAMPKSGGTFTGAVTMNGQLNATGTWIIGGTATFSSVPVFSSGIQANGITTKLGTTGNYGANKYNFMWAAGVFALYIDSTGIGNVQFSTSDYRIKQEVEYVSGGDLDAVMAGKPCTWEFANVAVWTADGIRRRGFIAHELQAVDPLLASGVKDAVDEAGNIIIQQLDPIAISSKLWGALQEVETLRRDLAVRVAAVEARLDALGTA